MSLSKGRENKYGWKESEEEERTKWRSAKTREWERAVLSKIASLIA